MSSCNRDKWLVWPHVDSFAFCWWRQLPNTPHAVDQGELWAFVWCVTSLNKLPFTLIYRNAKVDFTRVLRSDIIFPRNAHSALRCGNVQREVASGLQQILRGRNHCCSQFWEHKCYFSPEMWLAVGAWLRYSCNLLWKRPVFLEPIKGFACLLSNTHFPVFQTHRKACHAAM